MKRSFLIAVVFLTAAGLGFAQTQVRLTGHLALDFAERPRSKKRPRPSPIRSG